MKVKITPSLIILLLAISLTIGINVWTLISQSIRLDEAQSIWQFTKSIPTILKITGGNGTAPLYGIILHFWLQIFNTSIIGARIFSLVCFILTIPVLYKLAKEASTTNIAVITIILFSLSPFIAWYSNEAYMYTLFLLATTLNNLYFLRMYNSDGKTGILGYFLSAVMGLYTHYFFIFLLLTQGIFVYFKASGFIKGAEDFNYPPTVSSYKRYRKFSLLFLRQIFLAILLFFPWLFYIFSNGLATYTKSFIPQPSSYTIIQTYIVFLFGSQNAKAEEVIVSLWPLLILFILILFTKRKKFQIVNFEYFLLVTFFPVLLVYVISYIQPIFLSRYLILVTPTLFFVVAVILHSFKKRVTYFLLTVLMVLMFFLSLNQNISASTPLREDYKGVAELLNKNVREDNIIAVSTPFTIFPIEYYYSGQARIDTIPSWDRYALGPIPPYSTAGFIRQINTDRKQYKSIFVVLSYDQGYEKTIINYLDKHFKLEQVKKFSPGLQIREYRLRYDIK